MNDDADVDPEDDDLLVIDPRSPGERWAQSGRRGLDRLNDLIEDQRLDLAAMVWMLLIFLITGAEIYAALRVRADGFPGLGSDWWTRLQFLVQSGGITLIFGSAVGIALAVLHDSPVARRALTLAAIGGLWAIVSGFIGIAVSFHEESGLTSLTSGAEGKVVSALLYFGYAGLGLVIATIAWRAVRATPGRSSPR